VTTLEQIDPNLYAAQQALGPNATVADYEAYSAALDATNAAGASPLGASGSPGDVGGPALNGTPDAATTAAIAALPTATPAAAAAPNPATPSATNPLNPTTGLTLQQTEAQTAQSASGVISALLSSVPGLAALDPNGLLATWVSSQAGTLAGQGMDSSDIVTQIESTMNNPGTTGDAAAQAVFDAVFPGYNAKIAAGTTNADGSYTGIAGYIQYSSQLNQFATQAGLLPNTISQTDIGNLWAGNVSSAEVSQRITDATVATTSAPQSVQAYLANNFGMTPGAVVSYYLNPANTLQTIQQNINTGMVGGASAASGFDQNLGTAQAASLAAFLSTSSSGGGSQVGGVNSLSYGQATNAFTSGLGSNNANGSLGSAAQMATAGYTSGNLPGQVGGTVSENTLLGAIEGNATSLQQTQQAEQTRTAGGRGGGGATTTAKGAVGLGFASQD
jgi:hypothetical protein